MIHVLVVDDSPVQQTLLTHILSADPDIQIMGTAANGEEALAFLDRHKPDVITMDLNMPKMDGLETTEQIMQTRPVPIVIVSAHWDPHEATSTFRAMEAGAVAGVAKPQGVGPGSEEAARQVVRTVKAMSEVKVVRRWAHRLRQADKAPAAPPPSPTPPHPDSSDVRLVAIGASTGGPPVLLRILSELPMDFPVPVLIVQHIAKGFLQGLVEWLAQSAALPLRVPSHGDPLLPGHAYLAPDDFHLGVDRNGCVALSQDPLEHSLRPAVSYLFRSVAQRYGSQAVGVLLTGMGRDGAQELKLLKDAGATTIAQDKASSVVHGMPGEAIALGGATYVLSPDQLAPTLVNCVRPRKAA